MDFKPLNKKAYIMNAIIAVIAIASIVMLFVMSFWTLNLSLKIDGDMLNSLGLDQEMGDDPSLAETYADLKTALNDTPVVISINLDFSSSMLIGALVSSDADAVVEDFVNTQVGVILEGLQPAFDTMEAVVLKVGAKTAVSEAKKSIFTDLSEEDAQKVETALNEVGLTDSYIDETVDELIITLNENPKVDNVVNKITDVVEDVIDKVFEAVDKKDSQIAELLGEDLSEYLSMSEAEKQAKKDEIKADLREDLPASLTGALEELGLVDQDGNVNIEALLTELIASMIGGEGNPEDEYNPEDEGNPEGGEYYNAPVFSASAMASEENLGSETGSDSASSGSEEENKQTLEEMISDLLMESLGSAETVEGIVMLLKVLAIILILTAAVWVYLLVKLIVKTFFCKNKTVGLFIPRHIGWIAFVVFVGIPFVLNLAIGNPSIVNQLLSKAGLGSMDEMLGESAAMLKNFSITCGSGSIGSAIGTILLLFMLLPYRSLRRKIRRAIKKNKMKNI